MKCIKEALPRTQKPVHDSVSLQLGWHQEWPAQGRRTSTTTWRKSDVRVTAKMLRGAWNISFRRLFICANLSKTRGQFVSLKMTETIVYTKGKVTLCEMKQHSCFLLSKNWRITLGENRCFGLPLVRHKVPHERNVLSYVISKMQLWKATFSQLKWALCQMGKYALAMAIYCACWSSLLLAWAHQGQVGASTYTYQAAKCAKCISPIASQIVHSTDVMWLQLNTAAPLFSPSTSPSNLIVRSFHIDTPLFQNTQHPQSLWPSSTQLPSAPPATSWRCQWSLEARHLAPHTSTMPGPRWRALGFLLTPVLSPPVDCISEMIRLSFWQAHSDITDITSQWSDITGMLVKCSTLDVSTFSVKSLSPSSEGSSQTNATLAQCQDRRSSNERWD